MRSKYRLGSVLLLCSLAAGPVAVADEPAAGSSPVRTGRDTDLRALLIEIGPRLHKHFVTDPRVATSIDVGNLNHGEISYEQLLEILGVYGCVVIQNDGLALVVPNVDMRQIPTPLVKPDSIKVPDGEIVTSIIQLKNLSASAMVPMLRPLIPSYGHLAPLPDRNALLIVDRAGNVKRIVEIVEKFDALPKPAEIPRALPN
jgi:general secretion pathway protein D